MFGESHGRGIGARVIDGFPAGMKIDMDELLTFAKGEIPAEGIAYPGEGGSAADFVRRTGHDAHLWNTDACVIANKDQHSADYKM